ncbi:MAG TPA: DUF2784 domain-containing protein [Candidatus Acidoferrales bacterium]|nr:DUF2784 domain-containing protein [Candidatus Acidoferrales bacterium]
MYAAISIIILLLHLVFILWVILGATFTGKRPRLAAIHLLSLIWGLLVEILPWTCPLTFAENWLEQRAGVTPYRGGFLLHYLDAMVYPNVPPIALTIAAVLVFAANVGIYWRRWMRPTRS